MPAFDVIVLGAGPSGSAAAVTAARAGLSVALIDKARFPRDKLCGGGVTGRARGFLDAVFEPGAAADLCTTSHHVRLTDRGRILGDLTDAPAIHMTMRRTFDARLQDHALAAGAADYTGRRVASVDPAVAQVVLEDGTRLTARAMIGADGVNSAVARALFGRAYDPATIGFALEVEAPRDRAPDAVEIDLGAVVWGYGWSFPKAGGDTLGVGALHARSPDLPAAMAAFLAARGLPADTKCKGAFLPLGDFRAVPGRGAVLLAGDAAGLVDPITGEGIGWAIRSGHLAGEAVAKALVSGTPDTALAHYQYTLAPVHTELSRARSLRRLVYPAAMRGLFLRLLEREPRIQRRYLALLAGDMDYADIRAGALPRYALRLALSPFRRAA